MEQLGNPNLEQILLMVAAVMGLALVLAVMMLGWVMWRVRRINLPPDADFLTALRYTPLSVVILIDLLDLGLDFLSAPFAWAILNWLGLKPLRGVAVIEGLLPFTHFIPTMTVAWLIARLAGDRASQLLVRQSRS